MAKRSFSTPGFTPTAVADTAAMTANGCMALQGGSATQRTNILEVYMGGLATSSTPCPMVLARDSTVAATAIGLGTIGRDAALDAATAALAASALPLATATTMPQRSATLHLLPLSFNAFGGVVRWVAAPGEEISIVGASASLGEVSLSAFTGGTPGLMSAHIIYETM